MKHKVDPESIYHMREEIIRMQGCIHKADPNSTDAAIKELVVNLGKTRASLEKLMA